MTVAEAKCIFLHILHISLHISLPIFCIFLHIFCIYCKSLAYIWHDFCIFFAHFLHIMHIFCVIFAFILNYFSIFFCILLLHVMHIFLYALYVLLACLQTKPVCCSDVWPYKTLQVFSVFAIKASAKSSAIMIQSHCPC